MVGIAVTAVPMLDFDIFTHGNFTRLKNHPYFNGLLMEMTFVFLEMTLTRD